MNSFVALLFDSRTKPCLLRCNALYGDTTVFKIAWWQRAVDKLWRERYSGCTCNFSVFMFISDLSVDFRVYKDQPHILFPAWLARFRNNSSVGVIGTPECYFSMTSLLLVDLFDYLGKTPILVQCTHKCLTFPDISAWHSGWQFASSTDPRRPTNEQTCSMFSFRYLRTFPAGAVVLKHSFVARRPVSYVQRQTRCGRPAYIYRLPTFPLCCNISFSHWRVVTLWIMLLIQVNKKKWRVY